MKSGGVVRGKALPPYRILVNGATQDGGYETREEAIAAAQAFQQRHLDKYIGVLHHRELIWGKRPPDVRDRR